AIPLRAVHERRAYPPDHTSKLRCPDRLPCDGGTHATHEPSGPSSCCADSWARAQLPFASHHNPARACVSPAGGSVAVSDSRNSSKVMDYIFSKYADTNDDVLLYAKVASPFEAVDRDCRNTNILSRCFATQSRLQSENPSSS